MTALLLALAVAAGGAPVLPSLADPPFETAAARPPRGERNWTAAARYRVELDGEALGWARLDVVCGAERCRASWQVELRSPAEAGGGVSTRRVEAATDLAFVARSVRVEVVEDGRSRRSDGPVGTVPAVLAELLLGRAAEGERRCLRVADEESGAVGDACARRHGAWLEGETLGEAVRFRAAPGHAPEEVVVPRQRIRFVADAAAALPDRAPRLHGVEVPAARDAVRWCGRDRERASPAAAPPGVPRRFPPGASCRERTQRYLDLAAAAGWRGRHAVGVAHDGHAPVWHEWAELWVEGGWLAVDPSFEQAPAAGPRFTVGRWEDGDAAARAAAGRAVLDCWQR